MPYFLPDKFVTCFNFVSKLKNLIIAYRSFGIRTQFDEQINHFK